MNKGGAIVVGTTLLIALLHGALGTLLLAGAVSGTTYVVFRRRLAVGDRTVFNDQVRAIRLGAAKQGHEDKAQKWAEAAQKRIETEHANLQWGNTLLAKTAAVGTFAFPSLGAAYLGYECLRALRPHLENLVKHSDVGFIDLPDLTECPYSEAQFSRLPLEIQQSLREYVRNAQPL